MVMGAVDALTGTFLLPCPRARDRPVRLSAFRQIERLARRCAPGRVPRRVRVPVRGEHVGADRSRRARLGAARARRRHRLRQPHDLSPGRRRVELAALATARIDRGNGPGASSATRRTRRAPSPRRRSDCSRRPRDGGGRRPLPGVRVDVDQPRHAAARRRPVPLRRARRGRGPRLRAPMRCARSTSSGPSSARRRSTRSGSCSMDDQPFTPGRDAPRRPPAADHSEHGLSRRTAPHK